jgi:hypothetical protein
MRPARIAPQIRPVRLGGVDDAGSAPRERLASRRHDGPHPRRHWIARIGGNELRVGRQRVAFERRRIGILCAQFADRPRAQFGGLLRRNRWRRRVCGAFKEFERHLEIGGLPGHLGALGHLIDAQTHAIEDVVGL